MARRHPRRRPPDLLAEWEPRDFDAAGMRHTIYESGTGPAVIVLPEIPGITPPVAALATRLRDAGFTVALVSLFGRPGVRQTPASVGGVLPRLCVAREFAGLATGANRPVAVYVRALAADLQARHARLSTTGRGVGVLGMCFTGGFALAAAAEPAVQVAVGAQPSVPLPVSRRRRRDLGMSEVEASAIEARDDVCLLVLRFTADPASPDERLAALQARFGDAVEVIELDSSPGNPQGFRRSAHAVLTEEFVDDPTHPTRRAYDRVVELFREKLL